ncbi:MAG: hypothetical protein V1757_09750 [Actinomycetota bacterium]
MRYQDPGWGYVKAGLVGALVAAVVMMSFPVVASVGDALNLGQANSADAVTSLSGAADANLRVTNTQSGDPALDLRVVSGAPPLKVNSTARVPKLNADLLDGSHASDFATTAHSHDASAIVSGIVGLEYFPAYRDLGSEGFLNNDGPGDLLTRSQADGRFMNEGEQAADSDLFDGSDSSAFSRRGTVCPPGRALVGYGRTGPVCSDRVGAVKVDTIGDVGFHSSLVLDASGNPVISYFDGTNGNLKVVHCGNPTCSAYNTYRAVDTTGNVGQYTSLVLDASGYPVISYFDASNGDLKVAHCGDPTCSASNIIRAVDTGGVGLYTSLVLDASGNPVISYNDGWNGDLKVAHCGDPTCSASNIIRAVDTAGDVGQYTSLVLDAGGNPVISYYHATNGDLNVMHCADPTCSSFFKRAVDADANVGCHTSLVLDASGYPVISYYDLTNTNLMVVHCGNPTCIGTTTERFVDTTGDVGQYTSLVLDASGNPVISYVDWTNSNLKLGGVVG